MFKNSIPFRNLRKYDGQQINIDCKERKGFGQKMFSFWLKLPRGRPFRRCHFSQCLHEPAPSPFNFDVSCSIFVAAVTVAINETQL